MEETLRNVKVIFVGTRNIHYSVATCEEKIMIVTLGSGKDVRYIIITNNPEAQLITEGQRIDAKILPVKHEGEGNFWKSARIEIAHRPEAVPA